MTDETTRIPEHELEPDRRQLYRTGQRNARNVYRVDRTSTDRKDDQHIGCMFTPGSGLIVVHALNAVYGTDIPGPEVTP